jgi:hypothetical protein
MTSDFAKYSVGVGHVKATVTVPFTVTVFVESYDAWP